MQDSSGHVWPQPVQELPGHAFRMSLVYIWAWREDLSLLNRSCHVPAPQRYLAGPQTASDIPTEAMGARAFTQGSKAEQNRRPCPLQVQPEVATGWNTAGRGRWMHTQKPPQQEGTALPRSKPALVSQQQLRITALGSTASPPLPHQT